MTLLLVVAVTASGALSGYTFAVGCVIGCKEGVTCIIDNNDNCFKFIDSSYAERLENPNTENDDNSVAGSFNTRYTTCAGGCDDACNGAGGNIEGTNCCSFDPENFSFTLDKNCP
jgi:hypothetical protein